MNVDGAMLERFMMHAVVRNTPKNMMQGLSESLQQNREQGINRVDFTFLDAAA